MKRFPLLPQVALVFAVVYACTDATAPANSHALLTPKDPSAIALGDPPPPPVDAAIDISISDGTTIQSLVAAQNVDAIQLPIYGSFTGVYFADGTSSIECTVAATAIGDESLCFLGSAWLRLNNVQPSGLRTSANARFKRTAQKLFGTGQLMIGDVTIRIDDVKFFEASPTCSPGDPCAHIEFEASILNEFDVFESGYTGRADAFGCGIVTPSEGLPYYTCGSRGD